MRQQKRYGAELSRLPCEPELVERIRRVSQITGIPQAEIRRRALERYLAQNPQFESPTEA